MVVVGAGAVGLCTAFYLRQAGVDVHVIDRSGVGTGSSWGNAGWVCQSHSAPVPAPGVAWHAARSLGRSDSPLYLRPQLSPAFLGWLLRFHRNCTRAAFERGYAALARLNQSTFERFAELSEAGITTTLTRPGLVHAFLSVEAAQYHLELQRTMAWNGYEVPDEVLTGTDVAALDPALDEEVKAAYLVPHEGLVNPSAFATSLAEQLRTRGVTISENTAIRGFSCRDGRVAAVHTAGSYLDCSAVVIAAGVWSADLLGQLGVRLPLQSAKGYSFSVALDPAPAHPMFCGDKHVVTSPMDGTTRIAGTMEFSGNNRRLDWRRVTAIATASRHYLGRWYEQPDDLMARIQDPWVGGRAMLPDGLPVLDTVPGVQNAFVTTGHGMLGITLAPVGGHAIAEYILTGERPGQLEPFRSDRFPRLRAGRRDLLRCTHRVGQSELK